jgi:hypothetical protein
MSIRGYLAQYPGMFIPIMKLRHPERIPEIVSPSTDLVIEGYPRSGNSFAFVAFSMVQETNLSIAHHFHAPAQIIRAVELKIPVLLLIRDPIDAAISWMLRDPYVTEIFALREYIKFYRPIFPYRNSCTIVPFTELITSFGNAINRLNTKSSTRFQTFENSEENVAKCFERIDQRHREITGMEAIKSFP